MFLAAFKILVAAVLIPLGGDAIGPDSALTDKTGGFSINSGVAGVYVSALGDLPVRKVELVVFGQVDLLVERDLDLPVWPLASYVAGEAPLPEGGVPIINGDIRRWGTSGVAGGNRPTSLITLEVAYDLPKGEYIIGAKSEKPGTLLSGSIALPSSTGVYERLNVSPRGVLPRGVAWAFNVYVDASLADFNEDGVANAKDLPYWDDQFWYLSAEELSAAKAMAGFDPIPEPYGWFALWIGVSACAAACRNRW